MKDSSGIIKPSSEREWPKAPRKRVPIYTARDHETARNLYEKAHKEYMKYGMQGKKTQLKKS